MPLLVAMHSSLSPSPLYISLILYRPSLRYCVVVEMNGETGLHGGKDGMDLMVTLLLMDQWNNTISEEQPNLPITVNVRDTQGVSRSGLLTFRHICMSDV